VLQKGKITIPVGIRQRLAITEGDCVTIEIVDNRVVILPPNTVLNPTELLRSLWKGLKVKGTLKQQLLKASAAGIEEKLLRSE
jgi:AbrB family looped-hinge helix DNA binding protein